MDSDTTRYRIESVLSGDWDSFYFKRTPHLELPNAVLPGAFNPLHEGHLGMIEAARSMGYSPAFELSVTNVDKPSLSLEEIELRLTQFASVSVFLTSMPRFEQKAKRFRGFTFLVGLDTIIRVGDPTYHSDRDAWERAISTIAELGCSFLVFPRFMGNRLTTLADIEVPEEVRNLCREADAQRYRWDVSSTDLRDG